MTQQSKYILTIAIPTYNGGKTIADMLKILLPQVDERVEVIISDNASTDEGPEIIRGFMKDYPFIKYVRNEKNIGPDSNFLQCMKMAQGKYTHLLSDDDILIEGRLKTILDFLENNETMSLIYLNALGFHEKYIDEAHGERFGKMIYDNKCFVTTDKKQFTRYVFRMLSFLSCFICLTEAFNSYDNFDIYKGTNWLQTYIHILCSDYGSKKLGVIGIPCICSGIYNNLFAYNPIIVQGVNYRKLLDFAVTHGFDKKQMDQLFIWKFCFLVKRMLIKEKAAGIHNDSLGTLFKLTWKYPYAWFTLYPFVLLPKFLCRWIVNWNNKRRGYVQNIHTLREGDIVG